MVGNPEAVPKRRSGKRYRLLSVAISACKLRSVSGGHRCNRAPAGCWHRRWR